MDLCGAKFSAVIDVSGHAKAALRQLAEEVDLARVLRPQLQGLLLDLVGQERLLGILLRRKLRQCLGLSKNDVTLFVSVSSVYLKGFVTSVVSTSLCYIGAWGVT